MTTVETTPDELAQPAAGPTPGRRLRADARRNYEALLSVSRAAFRDGNLEIPLEEIARDAGVGIGTLYRHFPNRLALLEAVYRDEVDQLGRSAQDLLGTDDPAAALDAWLESFLEYAATKRALFHELGEALDRDSELFVHSRAVINDSAAALVERAQATGAVRTDIEVSDVVRLVSGCTMMPGSTPEQRQRMLDVIVAGLRT